MRTPTHRLAVSLVSVLLITSPLTACKKAQQHPQQGLGKAAGGVGEETLSTSAARTPASAGTNTNMNGAPGATTATAGSATTTTPATGATTAALPGTPAGAPGAVTATATAPGTATTTAATTPAAPQSSCFTMDYQHAPTQGHDEPETCANHRNRLRIPVAGVNAQSICVRVNGTPVKFRPIFEGMLGAKGKKSKKPAKDAPVVAVDIDPAKGGMNAKITARFCVGKIRCLEECKIPKDDFMDAIGGEVAEENTKKAAKWDDADGEDVDVLGQIDPELQRELDGDADFAMFDGWKNDEQKPACLNAQTSTEDKRKAGRKTASR